LYKDPNPIYSTVYYKLTQIDFNGDSQNFITVYTYDCNRKLIAPYLYPNPSITIVNLVLPEYLGKEVNIEFINSIGKIELVNTSTLMNETLEINAENLAEGIYTVRISTLFKQEILRFVKSN
jgi:hypothetical protein